MKYIEQIKDEYGNLMQLWGIYEKTEYELFEEGNHITKRRLLRTFESLVAANHFLKKT